MYWLIWDALRDLVPIEQFKKREKHPWRSATFKPANLLKVTLPHGSFSRFLDCTNGTKSHKTSHILAKHLRLKLFVSFSANYLMKTWDWKYESDMSFLWIKHTLLLKWEFTFKISEEMKIITVILFSRVTRLRKYCSEWAWNIWS